MHSVAYVGCEHMRVTHQPRETDVQTTTPFPTHCPRTWSLLLSKQTFHGGRLGELANAAVQFSVHRRAQSKGKGASGSNRAGEGSLGQVILPLRGLVHNLRPVIQPTADRPDRHDHGDNGDNGSGEGDNGHGKGYHDHDQGDWGGDGGGDGDDNGSGCWRSLRGELCGVFPAAGRRGRASADDGAAGRTSPALRLRLRLSISLSVKTVSRRQRKTKGVSGNGDESRGRNTRQGKAGLAGSGWVGPGGPTLINLRVPARVDVLSGKGRACGACAQFCSGRSSSSRACCILL